RLPHPRSTRRRAQEIRPRQSAAQLPILEALNEEAFRRVARSVAEQVQLRNAKEAAALEKRQCADLDAFARPRMRRCGRILECGVRGPACTAVFHRIEHLEYVGLFAPHPREPIPLVCWIVFDRIGLADASGCAPL